MTTYERLGTRLDAAANPETKQWWERYLKNVIEFRGVKMADIRQAVHSWWDGEDHARLAPADQRELAYGLVRRPLAEDKLAGILVMREILIPVARLRCDHIRALAGLFDEGAIDEWSTCDWLCVRVLGPLAAQGGRACSRVILGWVSTSLLWRRRAGIVAFVDIAPRAAGHYEGFTGDLLEAVAVVVGDQRRFAQTGCGWVLRELSLAEPGDVERFVQEHIGSFSREAVRSATKKLDPDVRSRLLAAHASV